MGLVLRYDICYVEIQTQNTQRLQLILTDKDKATNISERFLLAASGTQTKHRRSHQRPVDQQGVTIYMYTPDACQAKTSFIQIQTEHKVSCFEPLVIHLSLTDFCLWNHEDLKEENKKIKEIQRTVQRDCLFFGENLNKIFFPQLQKMLSLASHNKYKKYLNTFVLIKRKKLHIFKL